jgi:hypothetical protein
MTIELDQPSWTKMWSGLRERRLGVAGAIVAFVPIWIVGGAAGLLVAFGILVGAGMALRGWPCPRCREPFAGVGFASFPTACAGCGLPAFSEPREMSSSHSERGPQRALSPRVRKAVAGAQVAGGVGVLVLGAVYGSGMPALYLLWLESFGGLAVVAGVWLWRDQARGYVLTRALQLAQLVRIQSPLVSYAAYAGFFVDLSHTSTRINFSPGFRAAFSIGVGTGAPFGVAVNLWAAALLLALLKARAPSDEPADRPQPPTVSA